MARFRRKQLEIEAEQWFPEKYVVGVCPNQCGPAHLHCRNGRVTLNPGDWVVREPDGSGYYPISHENMQALYERIDDPIDIPESSG